MLYDCKRISCWIDRRLTGLAGPDYDATISFGLPFEPEDWPIWEIPVKMLLDDHEKGTRGRDGGI